jgi:hypothetical protein
VSTEQLPRNTGRRGRESHANGSAVSFVIAFSLLELYGSRSRQEGSLKKCPHMKYGYLKYDIYKLSVDYGLYMCLIEKHGY